jgi:hypothetical protein
VWLLNTNSGFYREAQGSFTVTAGPVWFNDLPDEPGLLLGGCEISW